MRLLALLLLTLFSAVALAYTKPGPAITGPNTSASDGYSNSLAGCIDRANCPASLPLYTGSGVIDVDNTIIENQTIDKTLTIRAANVIIRNNLMVVPHTSTYNIKIDYQASGTTVIEDNEMQGAKGAAILGYRQFHARRNYIWDMGADAYKAYGYDSEIESNWVEKLHYVSDAHSDIIQMSIGDGLTVKGNYFDCRFDFHPAPYACSIAIFVNSNTGPTRNIVIEENWAEGGNYTFQLENKNGNLYENLTVRNNFFGNNARFGPLRVAAPDIVNYVSCGNRYEATGVLLTGQSECAGGPPVGTTSPPAFSVEAGTYTSAVTLNITAPAGTVYYTADGSEPTTGSLTSLPIIINSTTQIRAIADDGGTLSSILQGTFTIDATPPPADAIVATKQWVHHIPLAPDTTEFRWEAKPPASADLNCVMGVGSLAALEFDDLAGIVKFDENGTYTVRNHDTYDNDSVVNYVAGQRDAFRAVHDIANQTYDVFVQSNKTGAEVQIADDYDWRETYSGASELNFATAYCGTGDQPANAGSVEFSAFDDVSGGTIDVPVDVEEVDPSAVLAPKVMQPVQDIPSLPNNFSFCFKAGRWLRGGRNVERGGEWTLESAPVGTTGPTGIDGEICVPGTLSDTTITISFGAQFTVGAPEKVIDTFSVVIGAGS